MSDSVPVSPAAKLTVVVAPILAVSGLFLTFGLFAAGETGRLTNSTSFGDSFGLWTQTLAVLVAIADGVLATWSNPRNPRR